MISEILLVGLLAGGIYYIYRQKEKEERKKDLEVYRKIDQLEPGYPNINTIGNGFLWKPHSESRSGIPALLTPPGWERADVQLFTPAMIAINAKVEAVGKTNGDRETYFLWNVDATKLPKNTVLQIGTRMYIIPNPAKRVD